MDTKEMIWGSDIKTLKEELESIKKNNPKIKLFYDWRNNPELELYLLKLLINSYKSTDEKAFREKMPSYIHYIEHFLVKGIEKKLFTATNIKRLVKRLNENFKTLKFIPIELSDCYGRSYDDVIEINSNLKEHENSPSLTKEELVVLYMFHEIGHKILQIRNQKVTEDYCMTFKKVINEKKQKYAGMLPYGHIDCGLLMIEESLSQELAEIMTYKVFDKIRPELRLESEFGITFLTNHDFYGVFEKPTVDLGRTLRGCSTKGATSKEILYRMIKKALDTDNFALDLISEYNEDDATLYMDLCFILQNMGNILNEKYASFGQRQLPKSERTIEQSLKNIDGLAKRNHDFREIPKEGLVRIDFEKYK